MLLLIALMPAVTLGQAPRTISHQGLLTDPGGDLVPDASRSTLFAIYTVAVAGSPIWSETQDVATTGGVFNVILGSVTPISGINLNEDLWLGIKVGTDAEMTPRTPLTSAPRALGLVMPFEGNLAVQDNVIADKVVYNQPRTQYVSVDASAFGPTNFISGNAQSWVNNIGTAYPVSDIGPMVAPVSLPHGAILKEMSCVVTDDADGDDLKCSLMIGTNQGTFMGASTIAFVNTSGNPGFATFSTTTLLAGEDDVNNILNSYVVQVEGAPGTDWWVHNAELKFHQVVIRYELNEAQ